MNQVHLGGEVELSALCLGGLEGEQTGVDEGVSAAAMGGIDDFGLGHRPSLLT